jgi:hypothetical protein
MLEHPAILLRPAEAPWGVRIADPLTGAVLGSARRGGRPRRFSWLRWWGTVVVEVREGGDEPLLCTLRRGWGPWPNWHVCDADGGAVGRVRGGLLYDRRDRPLGALSRQASGRSALYRDAEGWELALTEAGPEGVTLTFLPEVDEDPFLKMVLLAAALVHNNLLPLAG